MQLADDYALGAVDDECPVLGHQRNVAKEDFLFLDVANALGAGFGIFVEDREANRDFERSGVRHAALFALVYVVLELQADRVAALVAEIGSVGVVGAALSAKNFSRMKRIGNDRGSAIPAGSAKVMETLEVSALTLPVANGVVNEFKLGYVAEVRNREHGLEDGLKSAVVALAGQLVHLQKAVIGALLHFDQIWNLDRCWNFAEIKTSATGTVVSIRHVTPRSVEGRASPQSPGRRFAIAASVSSPCVLRIGRGAGLTQAISSRQDASNLLLPRLARPSVTSEKKIILKNRWT